MAHWVNACSCVFVHVCSLSLAHVWLPQFHQEYMSKDLDVSVVSEVMGGSAMIWVVVQGTYTTRIGSEQKPTSYFYSDQPVYDQCR